MIKINIVLLTSLLLSVNLMASTSSASKVKSAYSNGVKDSLAVVKKSFSNNNVVKSPIRHLDGYVAYKDANTMNSVEIVKSTALSIKMGYDDVGYYSLNGKDVIIFGEFDRKPDVLELINRLKSYNIAVSLAKVKSDAKVIDLINIRSLKKIKKDFNIEMERKNEKIKYLENYIALLSKGKNTEPLKISTSTEKEKCEKNISSLNKIVKIVDLKNKTFQVVNRVVTSKFLKKHKKSLKTTKPLNSYSEKHTDIEKVKKNIETVKKNVSKEVVIPEIKSFQKVYDYLHSNAVITKDNKLLMNNKIFEKGDTIFKYWVYKGANYSTGVVKIDNRYVRDMKKDSNK